MVKAIRVYEYGGVEVMKWEEVELGEPKSGQIRVKNKAIGVNYTDVYARKGLLESFNQPLPFTPGCEAVGVVIAVGPDVTTFKVGDMVAFAYRFQASTYAEEMVLSADRVVAVPPSIDPVVAAAAIFKGLSAQVLVRRCFKVGPGHTILFHAAAGGVGSLACQWANALGATVIGTVSTKEKAVLAKEDGCHHVIIHKEENFVDRVMEITSGKGVDGSLACLKVHGYVVAFGMASGEHEPLRFMQAAQKSIYYTAVSTYSYIAQRDKLLAASQELFSNIENGALGVRLYQTYPLSQVAQAHLDMESRKSTGSIVLVPDA
ncbi:putative 2-haloacrylate reductase [Helianthus debilis subsp. tardiflorus]